MPAGRATAFFKAMLVEPDSMEDWLIDHIGKDTRLSVDKRDLTPERHVDGTPYIPRN